MTSQAVQIRFVGHPRKPIIDIWRDVYCKELGWAETIDADFVYDDYSRSASYLLAYINGNPVGTARLVYPDRSAHLPVERNIGQTIVCDDLNVSCKSELTRLMVRPEARGTPVCGELIRHCIQALRQTGFRWLLMDVVNQESQPNMIDYLARSFGFEDTGLSFKSKLTPDGPNCTAVKLKL